MKPRTEPLEKLCGEDLPRPAAEARALLRLLGNGDTTETLRELIAVPCEAVKDARTRRDITALRAFDWRAEVLAEFECLLSARF